MVKCEWCEENYTDGLWDEHFWEVSVYTLDNKHIICDCCKKHLKKYKGV